MTSSARDSFYETIALALEKNFPKDVCFEFADALRENLPMAHWAGSDKRQIARLQAALLEKSETVIAALEELNKVHAEIRSTIGTFTPVTGAYSPLGNKYELRSILAYFQYNANCLKKLPVREVKSGPDNDVGYSCAQLIAQEYKRHFESYPATFNGRTKDVTGEPAYTPYDRICNVIERHYKIEMRQPTRVKAVQTVR
jgi:hypothetical protein